MGNTIIGIENVGLYELDDKYVMEFMDLMKERDAEFTVADVSFRDL